MKNSSNDISDAFAGEAAQRYDEKNRKLAPISNCLHFLSSLVLKELSVKSRVLCVGAGTGAEILSLAQAFPGWTFVALDPSASMLEVCRERMESAGFQNRCEFVEGYVQDLPVAADYDATLSFFVGHFIKREERHSFFQGMVSRLKVGGYLVNAEISYDLSSPEFSSMLKNWESVQALMGATPESLASLPKVLNEILTVLPPATVQELIKQSGIKNPVQFFQSFMIHGWYGKKES